MKPERNSHKLMENICRENDVKKQAVYKRGRGRGENSLLLKNVDKHHFQTKSGNCKRQRIEHLIFVMQGKN